MSRRLLTDAGGSGIVEFALLLPFVVLFFVGFIEFSVALNAKNSVNFASRDASLLAAEGGSRAGTDCVVLRSVERNVRSPADATRIVQVDVYWSDANGARVGSAVQVYQRSGSTTCSYADGSTLTVPYSLSSAGYPESVRCDVLAGCASPHTTLDTIGVQVTYDHAWVSPFPGLARIGGLGYRLTAANATGMEPTR